MKHELKTRDSEFCTVCSRPLVAGDTDAYFVRVKAENESDSIKVTAKRADGVVVKGSGNTKNPDGDIEYTLRHDMYSVPGKLILRVALESGKSSLTLREIECDVLDEMG